MNKKGKVILFISIITVIIIIMLVASIIIIMNKNKQEGNIRKKNDGTYEVLPERDFGIEYKQEELRDPTEFFSVESAIKKNTPDFNAERIQFLQGENIMTYSVYGKEKIENSNEKNEKYYIVRVDLKNLTYELTQIEDGKYTNLDEIKLEDDETEIASNGNNNFEYKRVSNEEMCRKYLEDFKQKALNNPEEAYQLLDEEYKNKRFSGIEDFKEYINLLRGKIENSILSKYDVQNKEEYTEYILVDNYNNSYTIRTTGIWDYKILLDNYTIKVDTYEENYNELDVTQKVQSNVYIFLQMINTKDYSNAYELLDETFKQNNFDTLEKFKEYVNTNFFDYNLNTTSDVDIDNEGSIYIYKTKIKSGAGRTAETKNLTVIMQLKEGTDFVMSFSFE